MAEVTLYVGGYNYRLNCRDGDEEHLLALGAFVDSKVAAVRGAAGPASETRHLLMAAILLADELQEAGTLPQSPGSTNALDAIAERLEALAEKLEKRCASA